MWMISDEDSLWHRGKRQLRSNLLLAIERHLRMIAYSGRKTIKCKNKLTKKQWWLRSGKIVTTPPPSTPPPPLAQGLHPPMKINKIGPLHDMVTWCGIINAGTQTTQWDFQNKGTRTSPARLPFVAKVPLCDLRPRIIYSVIPYHVAGSCKGRYMSTKQGWLTSGLSQQSWKTTAHVINSRGKTGDDRVKP